MSTITKIAKLTGFNISTVSRALNANPLISAETTRKVLDAAKKLNYQPNLQAKALAGKSSRIIGFVGSGIRDGFNLKAITGIEISAKEHGYGLMVCLSFDDEERTALYSRFMQQRIFDGVIFGLSSYRWPATAFSGRPCVYIDQWPKDPGESLVVTGDHEKTASLIFDLFQQHNVKRVIFYGQGSSNSVEALRLEKAREHCAHRDMRFDHCHPGLDELLRHIDAVKSAGDESACGFILEPLLVPAHIDPTDRRLRAFLSSAVFATFDHGPFGPWKVCKAGINVKQHHEELGRVGVQMLMKRIAGEKCPPFTYVDCLETEAF